MNFRILKDYSRHVQANPIPIINKKKKRLGNSGEE